MIDTEARDQLTRQAVCLQAELRAESARRMGGTGEHVMYLPRRIFNSAGFVDGAINFVTLESGERVTVRVAEQWGYSTEGERENQ